MLKSSKDIESTGNFIQCQQLVKIFIPINWQLWTLQQRLSDVSMSQKHVEGLLKHTVGSHSQSFWSRRSEVKTKTAFLLSFQLMLYCWLGIKLTTTALEKCMWQCSDAYIMMTINGLKHPLTVEWTNYDILVK